MKQWLQISVLCVGEAIFLGCTSPVSPAQTPAAVQAPPWLEKTVCYEIFVRSFFDSDGEGIGDLDGLIEKLDYVNDGDPATTMDLGANCIWLMPVAESPSYHGYDVTDYDRVEPDYGTNDDFRRLTTEAHRRGIRVVVDMVINHTSDRHPWFQEALNDPNSPYRAWYRFSPSPGPDNEWGDNNWRRSRVRDEYYYGFFSARMPDLDWETEAVREEMEQIASFWLGDMGADGLRLDAVWHLMEGPDGQAGHAPRTHDMLREYGNYVRANHPDAFTLGEVFDASDAIFTYYPDQLDAYFAFSISEGILDAVRTGDGSGLVESALRMQARVPGDRYAPFLRNHDQTRTLTALGGDLEGAELAAALLLTLPGVPFIYYGEELGMPGDKPDPRLRTPMPWTPGPNGGFTTGTPWEPLQPGWEEANVETLGAVEGSILNHYRRLIRLRETHPVLQARAEILPLAANDPSVVAWIRRRENRVALVVANLGHAPATGVSMSSALGAVPPGTHEIGVILGPEGPAPQANPLVVGADGRIQDYVPLPELAPRQAYVILLGQE